MNLIPTAENRADRRHRQPRRRVRRRCLLRLVGQPGRGLDPCRFFADNNGMNPIYLDYNATTPLDPAVVEAMLPYLHTHFGNPSSTHAYGKAAHDAVDRARQQVADLLGARPDEIVFTGGG